MNGDVVNDKAPAEQPPVTDESKVLANGSVEEEDETEEEMRERAMEQSQQRLTELRQETAKFDSDMAKVRRAADTRKEAPKDASSDSMKLGTSNARQARIG